MASATPTAAVRDSVAKVDNEIQVGEDLRFQRKWWIFENAVWIFFVLVLIADLAGAFGRGPLAKAEQRAADGSIEMKYERIERTQTPSVMTLNFAPSAIRNGAVRLFVSQGMIDGLGTRRIIPAPERTELGDGGLTYTFPATGAHTSVEFALEPSGPGRFRFTVGVEGAQPIRGSIYVMP